MVRVYAELKRRIMEGDLRPGDRLDPTKLGQEMLASMTPIRDALHQLKGEGLVETWKHEGFWIAELSETAIRDRYLWCRDLVRLCLSSDSIRSHAEPRLSAETGYPEAVAMMLLRIAALSLNQEHGRAMASLCDRSHLIRVIEGRLIDDPEADVRQVEQRINAKRWDQSLAAYETFHDKRMMLVPQIAALIRSSSTE